MHTRSAEDSDGSGPLLRPACWLMVVFTVLLTGVALLLAVATEFLLWVQDPADTGHYGLYLHTSNWWAVVLGLSGILCVWLRRRERRWGRSVWILIACDLGMLLAVLWPVQLLLGGVAFAARGVPWRGRRWWHGAVALAGAGAAVAGSLWGYTGYEADQPWRGTPTNLVFTGIWRSGDGGTLRLDRDGRFTTHGADPMGVAVGDWPDRLTNAEGTWAVGIGAEGNLLIDLTPTGDGLDGADPVHLWLAGARVPSSLIAENDASVFDDAMPGFHR